MKRNWTQIIFHRTLVPRLIQIEGSLTFPYWEYIFYIPSLEFIFLKEVGHKGLVNMFATCMDEDTRTNLTRPLFNFSQTM